ncbi:MAG: hypothetical protein A4E45_02168 [Methanosaeta sp. PtaB.Bin039]|nr:MAG: hypothetical protein A4E45_02168 [Methanosaeta sp. PtaB.Bin039]
MIKNPTLIESEWRELLGIRFEYFKYDLELMIEQTRAGVMDNPFAALEE